MKNKGKIIIVIVAIIVIGVVGFVAFNSSQKSQSKDTVTSSGTEKVEKSTSSSEEDKKPEPQEYSRKGALNATTDMLKELQKAPDGKMTLKERLDEVSKEGYDKTKVFTEEGWELLHLSDFMSTDPRGEVLVAQSMLSVLNAIEEAGNKDLKPADVELDGVVLFDKDLNMAFIPVDLYTNAPTKLSFEMVYKDSRWVFQPYTIISQIAIRTTEQGVINKTPEGQKVLTEEQKEKATEAAVKDAADKVNEKTKESSDSKTSDSKSSDKDKTSSASEKESKK